ncbi:Phosphoserine transaminase [Aspergillus tubingensis]
MPLKYCETLDNAARNLRDVMQRECALGRDYHIAAVKESTISSPVAPQHMRIWSPFSRHVPDPKLQARESEWLSHRSPREIAVRMNKPDRSSREVSSTSDIESESPPAVHWVLSTPKSTSMRLNILLHLGRPIDEVDRFIIACQTHESPKDNDVAKAFGILYFTSAADQQRLFELYCSLVNDWGVGEEELREAWQQNKLKEFILFRSSQIPSTWIHNESHWISQQDGFAANKETDFNIVFESQKHVLKPEDQQVPYQLWKPREKLEAYVFLCHIRNGYIPGADEDNWICLGFCTARDDGETQQVAKLYRELLDTCVFEEFWKAMVESKMVDLFRKYGLGDAIAELRNFETLLSAVGERRTRVYGN